MLILVMYLRILVYINDRKLYTSRSWAIYGVVIMFLLNFIWRMIVRCQGIFRAILQEGWENNKLGCNYFLDRYLI